MLIRFVAKNIYSFKDETEFNLFPNKTQRLKHHKVTIGDFEFLRYSAIYGANGSGKSNLIKSISLLETIVEDGKLPSEIDDFKFKLDEENLKSPISLGAEFIANNNAYFYTITFDNGKILNEYLAHSNKDIDELIFERNINDDIQRIEFYKDYYKTEKEKLFAEVLAEKLVQPNELLITFLSKKYPEDFKSVKTVFNWFDDTLVIIKPDAKPGGIAHILDKDVSILDFANKFIPSLNTGISEIEIEKKKLEDFFGKEGAKLRKKLIEDLKNEPNKLSVATHSETGEEVALVYENDEIIAKRLITKHTNSLGNSIEFNLGQESDGTKRLIDYIPAFQEIISNDKVYIIDEIERSIHPMTIKEIVTKLTLDEQVKGQLIFSTHESNLLDQNILRPDEIWFAQKDIDGSSKIYSLSDFKIHNTIDIENGYLKGRFGGIPFLGNLKDLNW
ncbi:MAG: AAA family ATPase [Saprospiraceae bacterium]|nr:AAA family ATPase [Saprospiraceae bacterium]MBK8778763.1 AAA family ATPase [Saprospiraceae bacterium]MBP7802277.1 AAA family ATPase [Saprospiraceae bacterium]MBP9116407.1 AAA family ATPase [Acidimicrobiia bacterium]